MNKSDSIAELAKALCKAQGEMKAAVKDASNPFFKSKYADFGSVWETCRGPLTANGLSVVQGTETSETGKVAVETILMHTSGEWMSGKLEITPTKNDPQAIGSAITYARRYALSGMVCLATEEDDDGNKASDKKKDAPPLLSSSDLIKRIQEATALPELENISKKYKPDYDALLPEEQVRVRTAKDKRKTELKEALNGSH